MVTLSEIATARLRIVPFEERHLTDRYIGWLNDPAVVRFSEQRHRKHNRASCRAYFEAMTESNNFFCALEHLPSESRHIGNVTVYVDRPNQLADVAIMVGDRSVWGSGVGFEAWAAVLHTLIEREGFRKVTGGSVAPNRAMIRIMEKAGMQPDCRRRAHYLIEGNPVDVVSYAAFSNKWMHKSSSTRSP
jgi:RimJ/RimL family protein N-acetyltransferase